MKEKEDSRNAQPRSCTLTAMNRFIDKVREALRGPLPGRSAQALMAPPWRQVNLEPAQGYRHASVLILLYPEAGEFRFPLIVRSAGPGPHGGQIALPGGAREQNETAEETALREAEEEIGVVRENIEILGSLTPLGVTSSGFSVVPVVAWSPAPVAYCASPSEVAECFTVALPELLSPGAKGTATVRRGGQETSAPCYRFDGRVVWGATAIMLAEFEAVVARAEARCGRLARRD